VTCGRTAASATVPDVVPSGTVRKERSPKGTIMDASHLLTARDESDIGDREAMRPPKTVEVGPMTEGDANTVPGMQTDSMPALSAPLAKSTGLEL